MSPSIKASLTGNLGERHRRFNILVLEAYHQNTCLPSVPDLQIESGIDRLFKIDLASKQKNVDYIVQTLKDDDMLYVSRAFKSLWLLDPDYSQIINPFFLENELFPQMRLQAVNKMRHWIQLHLRDPQRCKEFYKFYKEKDFKVSLKFLWHCSNEDILTEGVEILDKITPKHLKVLSEKVPQITKLYYENVKNNQNLLKYYLANERHFFTNIIYLLKSEPDVFFFVLENFFNKNKFGDINPKITKYIMRHHKNQFMKKPELYTAWFLNMEALAKCLSPQEVKDLVVKLARAEYLGTWFSYKTVEPLIKRLHVEERSVFKKLIFVDKAFGPTVMEWPYPIPNVPVLKSLQCGLFEDTLLNYYDLYRRDYRTEKYATDSRKLVIRCAYNESMPQRQSLLSQLFDQYRFCNYDQTLVQLRKRLKAESSPQNRQYILLVLVSKTGGRVENIASFLDLISPYKNEPVQIRAAIIRSLVKRAFIWRLAPEYWARLLEWGHGLGLDGSTPEAVCTEGLHAVVMRDLLAGVESSNSIWEAFLKDFSPLCEYTLTTDERCCFRNRLPALLLSATRVDPDNEIKRLHLLLDTLTAYGVRFDAFPGTVEAVTTAAEKDFKSAKRLLSRMYNAGVARKYFLKYNFEIMQTDASYVNALRHDISILENIRYFQKLVTDDEDNDNDDDHDDYDDDDDSDDVTEKGLKHERFLRKLSVYFTEEGGLAERYRSELERQATIMPNKKIARPLALLAGTNFIMIINDFDVAVPKKPQRQFSAALRANAHSVRPAFDLESFGWRAAGAKAVANRVTTCRQNDVERYLTETVSWSRTLRVSLSLAKRVNKELDVYKILSSRRPGAAFSSAVRYFGREGDNIDPCVWDTVKSHIPKITKLNKRYISSQYIKSIPAGIRAEYYVIVYKAVKNKGVYLDDTIFSFLHEVDDQFIFEEIDHFMRDLRKEKNSRKYVREHSIMYIGIVSKFLMLSTSQEMLKERFQKVGSPFFKRFEEMWKEDYNREELPGIVFDSVLFYLRFNKVFFDMRYEACFSLLERVTEWMHGFLPLEKWFDKYVTIHLTLIYFKTVRLCIMQNPQLFSDETKKIKDGPHMLGTVFSKLISREIEDSTFKYFPSVVELYGKELVNYFNDYFHCEYRCDESVQKFTTAVLKSLLSDKSVTSCILAKDIILAFRNRLGNESFIKDIIDKNQIDIMRFMCGNII